MTRSTIFFLLASLVACSSPAPRADDVLLPERKPASDADDQRQDDVVEEQIPDPDQSLLLGEVDAGAADATVTTTNFVVADVGGAAQRFDDARASYYEKSGALAIAGGSSGPYVNVFAYGRAPGAYSCTNTTTKAAMIYRTADGTYQGSTSMGACSVTVTSIGVPGERIVGSFTSKLARLSGNGPATIDVKGTFDVIRKADVK